MRRCSRISGQERFEWCDRGCADVGEILITRAWALLAGAAVLAPLLPVAAAKADAPPPSPRITEVSYLPTTEPRSARSSIRLGGRTLDTASDWSVDSLGHHPDAPLIVQFDRPVTTGDLETLEEAGADVVAVIAGGAVRLRMHEAETLDQIEGIRWAGRIGADRLVHRDLSDDVESIVRVILEPRGDVDRAATTATDMGLVVRNRYSSGLLVSGTRSQLVDLAAATLTMWVEEWQIPAPHNEAGAALIGADLATIAGYDGSTQIVAVADTGLGGGTPDTAHRDIPADRIVGIEDYSAEDLFGCYTVVPGGAGDPDSGHGTHVAGTVLSAGDTAGVGRGVAPAASLYFQAVEEYLDLTFLCGADGYYLIGIPLDLSELLADAYDTGARIHQDSWGSDAAGEYTADAAAADGFIADHPDMLMVVRPETRASTRMRTA